MIHVCAGNVYYTSSLLVHKAAVVLMKTINFKGYNQSWNEPTSIFN